LSDYGFQNHPLRKDFPITGFLEVYCQEIDKTIVYKPIGLMQNLRVQ